MSEQQRLQGIAISEGQRLQATDAAGKQFMFQASETRLNMDMNRAAGQLQQAAQSRADANAAQASAVTGTGGRLNKFSRKFNNWCCSKTSFKIWNRCKLTINLQVIQLELTGKKQVKKVNNKVKNKLWEHTIIQQ